MNFLKKNALYLIFAIAFLSVIGSYYFSEILGWAPCSLCWYQRMFMFAIALIIVMGLAMRDSKAICYIKPFALLGLIISFIHNLLYWGVISEALVPCENGVSCTAKYLELGGFITIPLLSFVAFLIVFLLSFTNLLKEKNEIN